MIPWPDPLASLAPGRRLHGGHGCAALPGSARGVAPATSTPLSFRGCGCGVFRTWLARAEGATLARMAGRLPLLCDPDGAGPGT